MNRILRYIDMPTRVVAGVMSGTSVDGIDVALVEISACGPALGYRLLYYVEQPYDESTRARIHFACDGVMSMRDAYELDAELGLVYADAVRRAVTAAGFPADRLDAVGLHGQTVYHAPQRRPAGVTVQLGDAAIVAEELGAIVVSDFRRADVAAGGHGAPLVPYCDLLMLRSEHRTRVALNIGGIANITWISPETTPESLIAFDTGPGNMLIDAATHYLHGARLDYDGAIAASGEVDRRWLDVLCDDPYFELAPPKSTGRERFGTPRARGLVEEGVKRGLEPADIVATLTALTARTIAHAIRRHGAGGRTVDDVVVGGGGVRNPTLMAMLARELPEARILPADAFGIPADAKEALCFAVLANETLCGVPANVPSVTGARHHVVLGAIRVPAG